MNLIKQLSYLLAGAVMLEMALTAAIAKADNDRDATPQERERIMQALNAMGCTSFKYADFEIDKGRFEIDDVICEGGRVYEVYLDQNYRVIKKELND